MPDVSRSRPRPLPAVLQPVDFNSRHSRVGVVSFSSTSVCTPSSDSASHSGESWFHIPSSQSSHSSTSSYPPLPKGARPPSPQPTRLFELDFPPQVTASVHDSPPLKHLDTFSSWKLEWRGISKIVKWAVPGDKSDDGPSRCKPSSQKNRITGVGHSKKNTGTQRSPVFSTPDKALLHDPSERGFSPYIYASPTSPLSPTTSDTCVDTLHDGHYSQSDMGHGQGKGFPASEVHFNSYGPPDELPRRHRSFQVSRCTSHVQELEYTNVPCAGSELGHGYPRETSFDMQDTFSNIHCSTTSLDSSYNWSRRPQVARSDLGHSSYVGHMPFSGFPSTFSLSYGRSDNAYVKSSANARAFRNFRSMQSAIALPVSTANTGIPLDLHRRPRKLRKSLRAIPAADKRASRLDLHSTPGLVHSVPYEPSARTATSSAVVSPSPPLPLKPQVKQPRKLKKRPSPALPPLPRTSSGDGFGFPPPVPPKPTFVPDNYAGAPSAPVSDCYTTSASAESPPALTNTSASISPDDEPSTSQESSPSSATCEDPSYEGKLTPPVKRPSLLRTESNRRWTVAVADVPDDLFIEELERLRRMGLRAGDIHGVRISHAGYAISSTVETHNGPMKRDLSGDLDVNQSGKAKTPNAVLIQEVEAEDEMEWLHARRAIFCCRELVRTERSYQERLQELADGNVSDAIPASLILYLPAVIGASKILSAHFNEDMSACGVAAAFLSVLRTLEHALVKWSGVVGEFFSGNSASADATKRKRDAAIPGFVTEEETLTEFGAVKVRCMSMHGPDNAYVARSSAHLLSAGTISAGSSSHWLFRPAFAPESTGTSEKQAISVLRKSSRRMELEKERKRKPPYRDLAILPTQRVTRYILLYKDLLKHTSISSPTRDLVEKAVEAAIDLAKKCDRAQDNATFAFHP